MSTRRTFVSVTAALSLVALAALASGCASPPLDPGVYVPAPQGTVYTYHRVSSGSFGTFDGPLPWTLGTGFWQGKETWMSRSSAGTNVIERDTHLQLGTLDRNGQPAAVYEPPIGFKHPLRVGMTWTDEHKVTFVQRNLTVPLTVKYEVQTYEDVTVPAGTFKAYRVRFVDSTGEVTTAWTAPSLSLGIIKRIQDRPATHPQGAGHLEGVLTSFKKP